ncbi:holo-ACP synthase [Pelagibacteraceae bacterium]|nr:holo-ACP synthase [Pelagibacteraceae bacterium]
MIHGNGIDIIDINRIRKVIKKYGNRFKKRCFSISEIERSEKRLNSVESYAKRYAAKEACAKALGTGLARGVFWKDIEVENNQYGKPLIKLHGKAKEIYKNMNKNSNTQIEVSLSDEKKYAIAIVTIYD